MKNLSENDYLKNMLNLIYSQNNAIIKKLDEITSTTKGSSPNEGVKHIQELIAIGDSMNVCFKENKLTYKQYYVLKYHLANDYVSDMYLSENTGVSYSSISQWKHKDSLFREFYDKIKSFK